MHLLRRSHLPASSNTGERLTLDSANVRAPTIIPATSDTPWIARTTCQTAPIAQGTQPLTNPDAQKPSRSKAQSLKRPVAQKPSRSKTQSLIYPVAQKPSRSYTQSLITPSRSRTPFGRPCRQVQTYLTRTKMSTPSTRMGAKRQQSPPALRSWSGISQQGNEGESTRRRGRRRR